MTVPAVQPWTELLLFYIYNKVIQYNCTDIHYRGYKVQWSGMRWQYQRSSHGQDSCCSTSTTRLYSTTVQIYTTGVIKYSEVGWDDSTSGPAMDWTLAVLHLQQGNIVQLYSVHCTVYSYTLQGVKQYIEIRCQGPLTVYIGITSIMKYSYTAGNPSFIITIKYNTVQYLALQPWRGLGAGDLSVPIAVRPVQYRV